MEQSPNPVVDKTKRMKLVDALAARLPFRPSPVTCWRWRLKGANGVRLKAERCGRIWMTTLEDVDEFIRLQSQNKLESTAPPSRTEETYRRLKAAGLLK